MNKKSFPIAVRSDSNIIFGNAEFVFTDVLWPDFSRDDLKAAILEFQNRERRFGNLNAAEVA